ncbi:hypothetical protein PGC08_14525 [Brevibacterium sp. BDJS002]|uniref:hypothetical protein n=1 Tax=Brevibacterium sp. BDJS002 TaxID=3020906 RepID=UPI0023072428|nr:hypothetical protein [Brevibacterium sp. BDJS002]WCE39203.1 hypothetical protein PGC08_14525 [Brevibacterium sp. BDJS002]
MTDHDFPADPEIESILAERLGGLGAKSTVFGAGGYGAKWSAKRLKTETAQEVIEVAPAEQRRILAELAAGTSSAAWSFDRLDSRDDAVVTLRGVVGSGVGSLNPAYVIIIVDVLTSTIGIAAHAKEGLIKQRTAQKAVAKVRSSLGLQRDQR